MKVRRVMRMDEAVTLQNRMDYMPLSDDGPEGSYMVESLKENLDGFLEGRAPATNIGVFPYLMEDGSVQYELRLPDEVFHPDSVRSAEQKPITNNHPTELVTPDNFKKYAVGYTGDVRQDQYFLAPKLTITEKEAIQDVKDGKRALSFGYTCDLEMTSGNWMGIHYDAIQRNIRYNHLAIVPQGRAGDAAKMKMDAADFAGHVIFDKGVAPVFNKDSAPYGDENINQRKESSMVIKIDELDYEVPDGNAGKVIQKKLDELAQVKADLASKSQELETKSDEVAKAQAKADQLKEDLEKLQTEKEQLEKADHSDQVQAAVKARMDLERTAGKAGVEVKADMSDKDIKKAVVISVYPSAESKLDEKDDAYLDARYDGVLEVLAEREDESETTTPGISGDSLKETKSDEGEDTPRTAADARKDMIASMKKKHRQEV